MSKNFIQIDFQLLGTEIPPKEISRRTGIIPDVALERGERNKTLDLPRRNIWSIRSQVQSDEVSDHWNNLEPILISSKEVIKEIAKTGLAKMTLIVGNDTRIPPITIPPAMSEFAGFIHATIDIDHLQQ